MVTVKTLERATVLCGIAIVILIYLGLLEALVSRLELSQSPVCHTTTIIARTGVVLARERLIARIVFGIVTVVGVGLLRVVVYGYRMSVLNELQAALRLSITGMTTIATLYLLGIHLADLSDVRTEEVELCEIEWRVVAGGGMIVLVCAFIMATTVAVLASMGIRHWCSKHGDWARKKTQSIALDHRLYGL
jgi:hypothetical protein